jgi:hypothetical protein
MIDISVLNTLVLRSKKVSPIADLVYEYRNKSSRNNEGKYG